MRIFPLLFFLVIFYACRQNDGNRTNSPVTKPAVSERIKTLGESYKNGKRIYSDCCAGCHNTLDTKAKCVITPDKHLDYMPGPVEPYFLSYVKDTHKLRAAGDLYVIAKGKEYNFIYTSVWRYTE